MLLLVIHQRGTGQTIHLVHARCSLSIDIVWYGLLHYGSGESLTLDSGMLELTTQGDGKVDTDMHLCYKRSSCSRELMNHILTLMTRERRILDWVNSNEAALIVSTQSMVEVQLLVGLKPIARSHHQIDLPISDEHPCAGR